MNNIVFGQYINTNSWLHKVDPRIKIIFIILMIISVFLIPISINLQNIILLASFFVIAFVCVITAKIPLLNMLKSMRSLIFLMVFTSIIQILSIKTGTVLTSPTFNLSYFSIIITVSLLALFFIFSKYLRNKSLFFYLIIIIFFVLQYFFNYLNITSYTITIYSDSVIRSLFIVARVFIVIIFSSLLSYTTMMTDLNYGISSLLYPLSKIKIKTESFSMMLSLVFRFIPTLLEETIKILKAQASRGGDFSEANIFKKVKLIISLLIPMFVISIKKAEDTADAMLVRGYIIGNKRSRIDINKIKATDIVVLVSCILIFAFTLVCRILFL
ncbi:MAG: energy-coupling factor transporter transmembrane protein EcfT [Acholeplasmatales bacterium]|nr:energy-coupling factor transporter transmembrane protein EcfT [Acholeplasmatales bacterium]